jgi:hypothetical protein
MKMTMGDESVFEGETPADVVRAMQRDGWSNPPKKAEFVEEVAERVSAMSGIRVRRTPLLAFLYDLERAGLGQLTELTREQGEEMSVLATGEETPGNTAPSAQSELNESDMLAALDEMGDDVSPEN